MKSFPSCFADSERNRVSAAPQSRSITWRCRPGGAATALEAQLPAFAEHGRETFDLFLRSAARLAREQLYPLFREMDEQPAELVVFEAAFQGVGAGAGGEEIAVGVDDHAVGQALVVAEALDRGVTVLELPRLDVAVAGLGPVGHHAHRHQVTGLAGDLERPVRHVAVLVKRHRYPVKSTSPALGSRVPSTTARRSAATASGSRPVVSIS